MVSLLNHPFCPILETRQMEQTEHIDNEHIITDNILSVAQ